MEKTVRNIIIFIIAALASGWIGFLINKCIGLQHDGETLGMGIWLALPLLITILLRVFAGDGWKDIGFNPNLKGNLKWYFVSIVIFPLITTLVLVIGRMLGWVEFSNFNANIYFTGFVVALIPNFIKNIFEEFVWRGYLTTKLLKVNTKDFWLYLIVGGVWGVWHLPYYLFFLSESDIIHVLPVGRLTFALIAILSMMSWSVMFVELYRITKSIWIVVILHMMEDSLINHLVIGGHITIAPGKAILISPIIGMITTLFYLTIGLLLRRSRISKEQKNNANYSSQSLA